jgi:hypothetical protein
MWSTLTNGGLSSRFFGFGPKNYTSRESRSPCNPLKRSVTLLSFRPSINEKFAHQNEMEQTQKYVSYFSSLCRKSKQGSALSKIDAIKWFGEDIISLDVPLKQWFMGARRGGQGGLLPPPGRPRPPKNSMFLDLLAKNSIFFVVY